MHKHKIRSWHSIDGIVTRLWAWRSRIWILGKASFYFPQTSCLTLRPTKPPIQWCWGSFPEVKQLGHEVDHSPVSRAEVMNECRYTSTPLIHLQGMAWVNFTFMFYISKIKYSNFTLAQWYTECPRRNVPDFRRVFFMLKYTDNNPKHLCPKLNGYGDNGQRSLKLWQLLHTYWLPNTY